MGGVESISINLPNKQPQRTLLCNNNLSVSTLLQKDIIIRYFFLYLFNRFKLRSENAEKENVYVFFKSVANQPQTSQVGSQLGTYVKKKKKGSYLFCTDFWSEQDALGNLTNIFHKTFLFLYSFSGKNNTLLNIPLISFLGRSAKKIDRFHQFLYRQSNLILLTPQQRVFFQQ